MSSLDTAAIRRAKNRAYQFCDEQQKALDEGRITEQEWFEIHERFFSGIYLSADNPRAQSGHGGDEAAYRYTRSMLIEVIHRGGTFIDVGCANGHLMEMLARWLQGKGLIVEFYGLDISKALLEFATQRLPHWQDRFFLGNALHWSPPFQFDYVCLAGLDYVPRDRRRELLDHLFTAVVAPGGRLIFGPYTEERTRPENEEMLRGWGLVATGYCEKAHLRYQDLCRRLLWFDTPSVSP